jgi:hypothetical protein
MSFIASLLMGAAGQVFRAVRDSSQRASEEKAGADAAAASQSGAQPNAVTQARSESERLRAGGKGTFAQHFQAQIAKATDTDGDGKISRDELAKKVKDGGGTDAQASALYKALDKNGDGTVTADELKDGTPVPSTELAQQIMQMIQVHRDAVASGQDPKKAAQAAAQHRQAQGVDAAPVLARLAAQMPAPATAKA